MRLLPLCLCLVLAACAFDGTDPAHSQAQAPDVWQEGSNGWVYGPSPFYLSPAGVSRRESTALIPDRIFFAYGSSELDFNASLIAALQVQRAGQLPGYDATLVCGWSHREAVELGLTAARALAEARCQAVIAVYRTFDSRLKIAVRVRALEPEADIDMPEAETFARLALVFNGRQEQMGTHHYSAMRKRYGYVDDNVLGIYFDGDYGIFLPAQISFPHNSALLTANAHAIMILIAEVTLPRKSKNLVLIDCYQDQGEGGTAPADKSLARLRCETVRTFLTSRGVCEHRAFFGENSLVTHGTPRSEYDVKLYIFPSKSGATGVDCQSDAIVPLRQN